MGIDDAAKAVEFLRPRVTVPMHYDTFDLIRADPKEFAHKAEGKGTKVEVLEIGKSLEI